MADDQRSERRGRDREPPPGRPEQAFAFGELRTHVPREIRDVSFPVTVRGYERRAVDAYVMKVNALIAELEVSRSPQAAVRHALDRVGEQTSGILQRARETAEEITASARTEADETTGRAKAEADTIRADAHASAEEATIRAKVEAEEIVTRARAEAAERLRALEQEVEELREQADTRLRKLDADTESVWQERRELVEEVGRLAARLAEIATEAAARFPERQAPEPPEDEMPTVAVAAEGSESGPSQGGDGEPRDEKPPSPAKR
jgi:DivIVA domain-containing protein